MINLPRLHKLIKFFQLTSNTVLQQRTLYITITVQLTLMHLFCDIWKLQLNSAWLLGGNAATVSQ